MVRRPSVNEPNAAARIFSVFLHIRIEDDWNGEIIRDN